MELLKKLLLIFRFALLSWLILTGLLGAILILTSAYDGPMLERYNCLIGIEPLSIVVGLFTGLGTLIFAGLAGTVGAAWLINSFFTWLFTGKFKS